MLKPEQIAKLAALAKLKPEDLTAAITSTEVVELTLDETVTTFTGTEIAARDASQVAIGKRAGETEGEVKGKELATKLFKAKLGIEGDSKDPETVATLAVGKMSGDNALKEQVTLLQTNLTAKETELATEKARATAASFDSTLLSVLPQNRSKVMETSEHLLLLKNNLEFTADGVKHKGQIMRDTVTQAALDTKTAVETFYKSRTGLLEVTEQQAGGRGGGDQGGAGKTSSLKSFNESWQKANPDMNVGSMEYNEAVSAELVKNPEMDMSMA